MNDLVAPQVIELYLLCFQVLGTGYFYRCFSPPASAIEKIFRQQMAFITHSAFVIFFLFNIKTDFPKVRFLFRSHIFNKYMFSFLNFFFLPFLLFLFVFFFFYLFDSLFFFIFLSRLFFIPFLFTTCLAFFLPWSSSFSLCSLQCLPTTF